ncbi:response regulator [Pseudalkalibacillus hwajinpoensis]|uniref:response regulator n=1 Tax=Guptibacillus hwajinpoensis TaxID=208199 RepID=UPI00325C028C
MLKVMVVDDEQVEREALGTMITREYGDHVTIKEAKNGREAIERAGIFQPDIMFMDIKMPGIDGVEAVKTIKKQLPGVRFIMLSAFDTFDYAREVMQQGVKEYLLKPGRKKEILAAFERISAELMVERKQQAEKVHMEHQLAKAIHFLESEWVNSILMNQVTEFSPDEWSELLGVPLTAGFALVFKFPGEDDKVWSDMCHRIKKKMKERGPGEVMFGVREKRYFPCFLFSETLKEKDKRIKGILQPYLRNLLHQFSKEFDAAVCAGIGRPYTVASQYVDSYREALHAVNTVAHDDEVTYVFYQEGNNLIHQEQDVIHEQETKLITAINNGDFAKATQELEFYFEALSGFECAGFVQKLNELFLVAERMMKNNGISLASYTYLHAENIKDGRKFAREKLHKLNESVQSWRSMHGGDRLEQVKQYIHLHYHEQLTLEDAAEHVRLSPYYVSKLFKDRSGMTFIDYVTEVRVEAAKRTMIDPLKSLKEICYEVGYKDPNYFSRVFKRKTGVSPSQYRDRLNVIKS